MDGTALIGKLGGKSAEKGRDKTGGTGQLERTDGTGKRWKDSHGGEDTTGRLEKTGKDS
jgi:hypothetical protein